MNEFPDCLETLVYKLATSRFTTCEKSKNISVISSKNGLSSLCLIAVYLIVRLISKTAQVAY